MLGYATSAAAEHQQLLSCFDLQPAHPGLLAASLLGVKRLVLLAKLLLLMFLYKLGASFCWLVVSEGCCPELLVLLLPSAGGLLRGESNLLPGCAAVLLLGGGSNDRFVFEEKGATEGTTRRSGSRE